MDFTDNNRGGKREKESLKWSNYDFIKSQAMI